MIPTKKDIKIRDLEYELHKVKEKNRELEREIVAYDQRIKEINDSIKATPSDCKQGAYCHYCAHSKYIRYPSFGNGVYVCNYVGSCTKFVPKEGVEVE